MEPLIENGIYEHYKGHRHRIVCLAKIEETLADAVVYEELEENELGRYWIRPVADFLAEVEVAGVMRPRFRYTGEKA